MADKKCFLYLIWMFLFFQKKKEALKRKKKLLSLCSSCGDCGFDVGHSVRSLEECEKEGKQDITIATNLLESRYLSGDVSLFNALDEILKKPDFWAVKPFFDAKVQEQIERYQRYHNTSYNLEPDLKIQPRWFTGSSSFILDRITPYRRNDT